MGRKHIFSTEIIPQKYRVLAEAYHRHHRDRHISAVTLYRVSDRADGGGGIEWLLTRFHNKQGKAYSAILCVEHDGREEYLYEFFSAERKQEQAMIEEWKRFVEEEDDG